MASTHPLNAPRSRTARRREHPTAPPVAAALSRAYAARTNPGGCNGRRYALIPLVAGFRALQRPEHGRGKLMRQRTVRITIGMILWAAFFFGLAMTARGAAAGMI